MVKFRIYFAIVMIHMYVYAYYKKFVNSINSEYVLWSLVLFITGFLVKICIEMIQMRSEDLKFFEELEVKTDEYRREHLKKHFSSFS